MRNSTHPLKSSSCGIASSKPVSLRIMSYLPMHLVHCWPGQSEGIPFRCNQAQIRSCASPQGQDHFYQHAYQECPTHYIRLTKPIRRDQGYSYTSLPLTYFCTSALLSLRSHLPTLSLSWIPCWWWAAHLTTQEATFHQRVLEKDYHHSSSQPGQGSLLYYALEEHDLVQ